MSFPENPPNPSQLLRLLSLLFLTASIILSGPSAYGASSTKAKELVVAIPDTLSDFVDSKEINQTVKALDTRLDGYRIKTKLFILADAGVELDSMHPDFVIAPTGFDAQFPADSKNKPFRIATRKLTQAENAAHSVGALFVVRKNDQRFNKPSDLKGSSVASTLPSSITWLAALGELKREGFQPDGFFKDTHFLNAVFPDILSTLMTGKVDAIVIPTCAWESLEQDGYADLSSLKPIGLKNDEKLACRHSTAPYPDLSLMAFEWTDEKAVRAVTRALFDENSDNRYEWLSHVPHNEVLSLYKELAIGPFHYLKESGLKGLWHRYHQFILLFAGLLIFLLLNELRLHHLVKKRTLELSKALERQKIMEREARETRLQLGSLERRNIVNQMSGLIAHDIKNPLGTILNFTAILKYLLPKEVLADKQTSFALESIRSEAGRIGAIVDKVRAYAKARKQSHVKVNLTEVCAKAIKSLRSSFPETLVIKTDFPEEAFISGDKLELELMVFNLLKNGVEAQADKSTKFVELSIRKTEADRWLLSITNPGDRVSDDTFSKLTHHVESMKPDGLGMGLSIIRSISENHDATLLFSRPPEGGLTAECLFDQYPATDTNGNEP